MTDQDIELWHKAAKAAGEWDEVNGCVKRAWCPLTRSEDALELMVKLEIHAGIGYRRIDACAVGERDGSVIRATESKTGDFAAAMRRAITRCAAAIQEAREAV